MSLSPGTRVGPYEIIAPIGSGGMGEVYRARDRKLNRDVALKVLPADFAQDADRLARFQREAQVLASLNHPNIGGIYGLEETDSIRALVLEFVEGPTLADVIEQRQAPGFRLQTLGPTSVQRDGGTGQETGARSPKRDTAPSQGLSVDEALPIARQIAEALEAAHEHGIVHRDLKPANIKVRDDGTVKVLDFGLAKLVGPAEAGPYDADRSVRLQADGSQSPTMSLAATRAGVILGTAAYMSPEQAKGRPLDKRADIWAFGCVLYELLTGTRAFDGEDVAETMAFVMAREPDWSALPRVVAPPIRSLLKRCLDKDRRKRIADISTALFVLDEAASPAAAGDGPAEAGRYVRGDVRAGQTDVRAGFSRSMWRRTALVNTAALCLTALLAGAGVWLLTQPAPPSVVRTTVTTSGSTALTLQGADRDVAITPDGSRIVYRGNNQLLVRALNQLEPDVLSGLGAPRGVFISPDGEWIGFFEGGNAIKKVAITGGPPVTVCAVQGAPRGATWSENGTIIFATATLATGLQRVSAAGGEPTVLTKPDRERGEGDHLWPEFLPGGEAVLFTITPVTGIENAQIAVLDLQTGTSKVLIRVGSHAHYVPTGHLVYGVTGTLRAVAFDLGRREVVGTAAPVLEGVVTTGTGAAEVAVAASGSLVYVPGRAGGGGQHTVVSVDRQGRASPLPGLPLDAYRDIRVSSDGARLALATQTDVWTYDVVRATLSRLTTDPAPTGGGRLPLWSRDGRKLFFGSLNNRQMLVVPVQSGDDARRRASAGVVRIRNARARWASAVRHRPRWTVPHHPQWPGGSGRRHVEPDRRAELAGGAETARAGELNVAPRTVVDASRAV